jgi:hypothetical protein
MEYETRGQETPKRLMYRLVEAFFNMSLRYACCNYQIKKAKFPVLGLLSSSARLSGFLKYWIHQIK